MTSTIASIPVWAICYILYGDASSLTEEDETLIREWWEENNVTDVIVPFDNDGKGVAYFSYYPAFGKGSDVIDCKVLTA